MLKSRIAAAIVGSLMCFGAAGSATAQDTIKIGANLPMSGPNAELGEIFSRAASIAVKHINADKMLSKKLELAIEDSQATPQGGVVAMNKLVSVDKVPYVLSAPTRRSPRRSRRSATAPRSSASTAARRPGPCRARRLFLERDPAGQFRGRGAGPLSS